MFNLNTFAKHLDELGKYLKYLKILQKHNKESAVNNWQVYGLIERYLHLSIECCFSLGEQVISNYGLRLPSDYNDIINILCENKVISKKLAKDLEGIAGFRNILVHGYAKIDRELVYKHLKNDLSKLNSFAKSLAAYVKV
ncbi:DUF86 domain-containing protein [Candidatus Saganbacteria bacterium]|nr:DUF86 domain-containing protein [Candidatus Saganbacteria bacterium]